MVKYFPKFRWHWILLLTAVVALLGAPLLGAATLTPPAGAPPPGRVELKNKGQVNVAWATLLPLDADSSGSQPVSASPTDIELEHGIPTGQGIYFEGFPNGTYRLAYGFEGSTTTCYSDFKIEISLGRETKLVIRDICGGLLDVTTGSYSEIVNLTDTRLVNARFAGVASGGAVVEVPFVDGLSANGGYPMNTPPPGRYRFQYRLEGMTEDRSAAHDIVFPAGAGLSVVIRSSGVTTKPLGGAKVEKGQTKEGPTKPID